MKANENKIPEDKKKYRQMNGSATVEMAYIMPVVLLVFIVVMYVTFYFHDKNILSGIAYETAVLGTQKERMPKGLDTGELETHFQKRIDGKMILFSGASVQIKEAADYIVVNSQASKKRMRLQVTQKASITEPEKFIRLLRKIDRAGE